MSDYKIITTYVRPPVPTRAFDYCAYFDGEEEGPVGWGRTIPDALEDLQMALCCQMYTDPDERAREDAIRAHFAVVAADGKASAPQASAERSVANSIREDL